MSLDQKYPCIDDLERAALRRMPRFASEYLRGGIGREVGLRQNRSELDKVQFNPVYLRAESAHQPDTRTTIFGREYAQPFGICPVGLSGLMWPRAVDILAKAAAKANIPMALSHHATTHQTDFRAIAGENGWFQFYPPHDANLRHAMLDEIAATGFEVLVVTVDIPSTTRRDRELRVDLSVPPRVTWRTMLDVALHPRWALATLPVGAPRFYNFMPYMPKGMTMAEEARWMLDIIDSHVTLDTLRDIRARWKGKLVVKGVITTEDAKAALDCGADGIWVSNHGARQLDACPSPIEVLPDIRDTVGDTPILVDSGPRTGLDIARMLAKGADMVMLGRAFIFAVAALGRKGGDHATRILTEELRCALAQIGAQTPKDLAQYLR